MSYAEFAGRLVAKGIISDPWLEGRPRFRAAPELLTASELDELYRAAEDVTAVYNEVCRLCARDPALLGEFLELTPFQKYMWHSSSPSWHGIARADIFRTEGGLAVCELNSDTPTGEAEAMLLGELTRADHEGAVDPNAELARSYCDMVERMAAAKLDADAPRTLGILYPTEMPEDLPLIRMVGDHFAERGFTVVLGSPFNLTPGRSGAPALFGTECSVLIRHYKTDWWGERASPWLDDEDPPDALPLDGPLALLVESALEGRSVIVNPFGAVVPQNKRSMALMWEEIDRFPEWAQGVIRARIPFTVRLEAMHREQLLAERGEWVLKSAYGCEGEEVVVGRLVTPEVWQASLAAAAPGRWIAQRYFAARESASGESVNYGVFVAAGWAAGLYLRVQRGATDMFAQNVPALVVG
jgi:glutathionylspermidine synthase